MTDALRQIGYGSNKKTRHLMPSGHKAFLVHNGACNTTIQHATGGRTCTRLELANTTQSAMSTSSLCTTRPSPQSTFRPCFFATTPHACFLAHPLTSPQNLALCLRTEAHRHHCQGEAVGRQGDERQGPRQDGVVELVGLRDAEIMAGHTQIRRLNSLIWGTGMGCMDVAFSSSAHDGLCIQN